MSAPKTTVLYHRNCLDGITAAWVASLKLPHARFVATDYHDPVVEIEKGEILYILDFSYSMDKLRELCKQAELVILIDHHETAYKLMIKAEKERTQAQIKLNAALEYDRPYEGVMPNDIIPQNLKMVVDIHNSGAKLTWEFFFGHAQNPPDIVAMVGDADTFQFKIGGSREYTRTLATHPMDISTWDRLSRFPKDDLIQQGFALIRSDKALLDWIEAETRSEKSFCLDGDEEQGVPAINVVRAPMFNCPKPLYSTLNARHTMEHPLVISFFDTAEYRSYRFNSDRNNPDAFDCEALAVRLGGGGHKNSASVKVPHDHWFNKL
ncbi:hypothetical protein D3C80_161270 [compost metagenome]|jgi:hypothetical protein